METNQARLAPRDDLTVRIIAVSILMASACFGAYGQSTGTPPAFEVASIRPSSPHSHGGRIDGGPGTKDPGRFTAVTVSLLGLVQYAFDAKPHQYECPGLRWMDDVYFDINANVPPGATREQFHLMLQNLLVERFGLKFHREPREMPMYELVIAKSGPKLKESAPGPDQPAPPFRGIITGPNGFPVLPAGNRPITLVAPGGRVARRGRQETAGDIAAQLSQPAGRPVIDRTGLKGKYDYTLYYQMERMRAGAPPSQSGPADSAPLADSSSGPTVFEAIQQQLGLKLLPKKGPVPIFVIDYAQKTPSEN